jgi:site-specific DNA-cytosine methylase
MHFSSYSAEPVTRAVIGHPGRKDTAGGHRPAPSGFDSATDLFGIGTNKCIHPYLDRALTSREGARIQSYDDTFKFARENRNAIAKQIGNAVPPCWAWPWAAQFNRC